MPVDRFEEELRAGLRRLAEEAPLSPDARDRLHRRVRREPMRRLGIVAVSYAMVVVVAAVAFVGIRLRNDQEVAAPPDSGPAATPAPETSAPETSAPTSTTPTPGAGGTTPPTRAPGTSTLATTTTAPGAGFADRPRVRDRSPLPVPLAVRLEAGRHDDERFDRVVVEFDGPLPGYDIRYVDQVVGDGSGEPVALLGGADLKVTIRPANAHDDQGAATLPSPRLSPGFAVVKEVRLVSDFEAVVTIGIGVASRTPFRVLELSDPNRLVIDLRYP